jgi:hypothetical protein
MRAKTFLACEICGVASLPLTLISRISDLGDRSTMEEKAHLIDTTSYHKNQRSKSRSCSEIMT